MLLGSITYDPCQLRSQVGSSPYTRLSPPLVLPIRASADCLVDSPSQLLQQRTCTYRVTRDQRAASQQSRSTFPSSFYVLLFFGVQLIADVVRHIVVVLQPVFSSRPPAVLYALDQLFLYDASS